MHPSQVTWWVSWVASEADRGTTGCASKSDQAPNSIPGHLHTPTHLRSRHLHGGVVRLLIPSVGRSGHRPRRVVRPTNEHDGDRSVVDC